MGESPFEETEARESAERAAEAVEAKDPLLSQVTLTIAILAVAAAIGASLETTEGDKTIVSKNEAVLQQNQATDAWNFYEAKSLKKNLYALAADHAVLHVELVQERNQRAEKVSVVHRHRLPKGQSLHLSLIHI